MKRLLAVILLSIAIFIFISESQFAEKHAEPANTYSDNRVIYVDLLNLTLELIDLNENKILKTYKIAVGKYDSPSPIGSFKIVFKDKWGEGFGTHFMGINVPWGKYGIHGTDNPASIGWPSSHGCIRMNNQDIKELYQLVFIGTKVIINGGPFGPFGNGLRTLKPGDRGADVYEVQIIMKEKGYYPLKVDGIYGEGMKAYVLKYRKDHNMAASHDIDIEFYNKLGIILFE